MGLLQSSPNALIPASSSAGVVSSTSSSTSSAPSPTSSIPPTTSSIPPTAASTPFSPPASPPTPLLSSRTAKQLGLFAAGATFFALTTLIARRAVTRRRLATIPTFYAPSHPPVIAPVNGALEALEALQVATAGVASGALMLVGGAAWAWDVVGLEELRTRVRAGLGVGREGEEEGKAEREFEEWLAGVLERKKGKEGGGRDGREEEVD